MIDKFYQVFVSSTQADLKEERLRVTNTFAKAGYVAAGMELFPATDQQQLEYIKRVIDRSDYYVVIVGGRYGSVDDEGISFTEREFDYARSKNIPVLAFLHAKPSSIPVGKTDEDSTKAARLIDFRKRLQTGRIVEFWTDANDLCTKAVIAVANAVNLMPGVGWVRGDNAINPKLLQDFELLRNENAELQAKVAQFTSDDLIFDSSLIGPDDQTALLVKIRYRDRSNATLREEEKVCSVLLGDLFVEIYDDLLKVPPEWNLQTAIAAAALELVGEKTSQQDYKDVAVPHVTNLRHQFEGLGLIRAVSREGNTPGNRHVCWEVSEKGRRFVTSRKVERKTV
jgi:hypothetical protein